MVKISCSSWIYYACIHLAWILSPQHTTVNFHTIKLCLISAAVVINLSLRSFCMLKMPPLCHPSSAGAATSCLAGGSRCGHSGWFRLPALPAAVSQWMGGCPWCQPVQSWSSTLSWAGSMSMRVVALTVPNHTLSGRAGYCQLVSQVFSIIRFFFFYTLCSNKVTAARISFVCGLAVLKSHPDILLSSPWCFYCSYKQQTVKWALH